jgi:predicted aconitase with swiveling domain
LSLWGGLDPATGEVIDRRHPLSGMLVTGRVLSIPFGRGSCSASGVLLEAIQAGTAPAGIVVSRIDPVLGLGAILGDELLGLPTPILLLEEGDRRRLLTGMLVEISGDGILRTLS